MPEILDPLAGGVDASPAGLLARLLVAVVLGALVAWIYRHTRAGRDVSPTFPPTLVLLAVLIAMVTQVIGDNVARAFSLVGALSIVRFRTVVRDTQDTAFVIFSVVVGMAVGAQHPWVAIVGIGVVGGAAFLMRPGARSGPASPRTAARLKLRVAAARHLDDGIADVLAEMLVAHQLLSIGTARQGTAFDVTYDVDLRKGASMEALVRALNRIEGVQNVEVVGVSADPGEAAL